MRMDEDCRAVQGAWMAAFDAGVPISDIDAAHLTVCPACRAFADGAEQARLQLQQLPVPEPDFAADMRLLARLREERNAPWWQRAVRQAAALLGPRQVSLPLAGAGLASFAATLIVA